MYFVHSEHSVSSVRSVRSVKWVNSMNVVLFVKAEVNRLLNVCSNYNSHRL